MLGYYPSGRNNHYIIIIIIIIIIGPLYNLTQNIVSRLWCLYSVIYFSCKSQSFKSCFCNKTALAKWSYPRCLLGGGGGGRNETVNSLCIPPFSILIHSFLPYFFLFSRFSFLCFSNFLPFSLVPCLFFFFIPFLNSCHFFFRSYTSFFPLFTFLSHKNPVSSLHSTTRASVVSWIALALQSDGQKCFPDPSFFWSVDKGWE
jgi:hypothetical protein